MYRGSHALFIASVIEILRDETFNFLLLYVLFVRAGSGSVKCFLIFNKATYNFIKKKVLWV